MGHFYPRPPRGGRHILQLSGSSDLVISIHALREEGDLCIPCACWLCPRFLSTPSARRATITDRAVRYLQTISIHALREEGDFKQIAAENGTD